MKIVHDVAAVQDLGKKAFRSIGNFLKDSNALYLSNSRGLRHFVHLRKYLNDENNSKNGGGR